MTGQEKMNLLRNAPEDTAQGEERQREVDRLYNTSPVIFDYSETYIPEGHYTLEEEEPVAGKEADVLSPKRATNAESTPSSYRELTFTPVPVLENEKPTTTSGEREGEDHLEESCPPFRSLLSKLIEESNLLEDNAEDDMDGEGIPLIIYLPDFSAMNVTVRETSNFREVIMQILTAHERKALQPPLAYADVHAYELRIHEGDGEPDRDFPAMELDKMLSDFNLDEYCLCDAEGGGGDGGGVGAPPPAAPATPMNRTSGSNSNRNIGAGQQLSSNTNTANASMQSAAAMLFNGSSNSSSSYSGEITRGASGGNLSETSRKGRSNTIQSDNSLQNTNTNYTIMIIFPDSTQVIVPFTHSMILLDLLPSINKVKRLRLYTDEYSFFVSPADQKRLKLMSPQLDMYAAVKDVGTNSLEIQKKVYADSAASSRGSTALSSQRKKINSRMNNRSNNFTEAFANAYQEWNVVKKNKFGRKQERVFGVDGKKIYNSKRGQLKGHTGVQRAERDINTIVKLEILPTDPRTFRITWMDDRDVYNIEYTCETVRECSEIVTKINYTRGKGK